MRRTRRPPRPTVVSTVPDAELEPLQPAPEPPRDMPEAAPVAPVRPARVSMQRHLPRVPDNAIRANKGVLVLIIGLAAAGIIALVSQYSAWPTAVQVWWPLLVIGFALLWLIGAFARKSAPGLLGSTALLGVGISLLLATAYGLLFSGTWLGVSAITLGAGIMLRGLLWRSAVTARR